MYRALLEQLVLVVDGLSLARIEAADDDDIEVKLELARSTHNKGDASVVNTVSVSKLTGRELKEKEEKERKFLDRRKERGDSVK